MSSSQRALTYMRLLQFKKQGLMYKDCEVFLSEYRRRSARMLKVSTKFRTWSETETVGQPTQTLCA